MPNVTHLADYRAAQRNAAIDRQAEKQAVATTICDLFAAWPIAVLERAIAAAHATLDAGGTFLDAMDAAEKILVQTSPRPPYPQYLLEQDQRNVERLAAYLRRREARRARLWASVEQVIEARMLGRRFADICNALKRAQRVLEGGGTSGLAVYHALAPYEDEVS
jgi:hypothetical protein